MLTAWPYIDVIYAVFATIISIAIFFEGSIGSEKPKSLRIFASITSLVIWFKALYFLRRVDQMNVTIEILLQMIQKTAPFVLVMIVVIFTFG